MFDAMVASIASSLTPATLLISSLVTYLALVRLLRYRRIQQVTAATASKADSSMTFAEAQSIIQKLARYEFPFTFERALQLALFKTYGIPTISSLLVKTSLFSAPATASKRYADTGVLIADFITGTWGEQRWLEGLSRVNCIHAPYQAAGTISNDDLLYTLGLFALEPISWISRYEWRAVTDIERCAIGAFWKGIGDGMSIDYNALPSAKAHRDWKNGLHWLEELETWTQDYERTHMLPHKSNHDLAEQTIAILLWTVPESLKPLAKQAVHALMDARLRAAMMYPEPPRGVSNFVHGLFQTRRFILRHLALPRPAFWPYRTVTDAPDGKGRYYLLHYESLPYYVKPTLYNRYLNPMAWVSRLRGLPLPGDDGDRYLPGGYTPLICGPGHGKRGQKEMEGRVRVTGDLRCPVAFSM